MQWLVKTVGAGVDGHNHYCYGLQALTTGKYTDDSVISKCGKYSYLPGGNITKLRSSPVDPGPVYKTVTNYRKEFAG